MSRPVHDRLRELESEVRDMEVLPAAAVRARGRRRARRQLAATTAAGAVVAVTAGVVFAWPSRPPAPTGDRTTAASAPAPAPGPSCVLDLPAGPAAVRVRVLDGGVSAGLLDATTSQLRTRRFTVLDGTGSDRAEGPAVLRYGPAAVGAAAVLRATLYGETTMRFEPDRAGDSIDLILGPAFTRLATPTEINQNLVDAGKPTAPPECG